MEVVSIQKCQTYEAGALAASVEAHFRALGLEADLRPGLRVLIKPNLLTAKRPEAAATTHPALVRAIAQWFRARGVTDITLADSAGGPYTGATMKVLYRACQMDGLKDVVRLNEDFTWRKTGRFNLITPVCEADYIVDVARLKTHGMTTMTGCTKNLFGCIPGLQKSETHCLHPDLESFSGMLVDLAQTVAPRVCVLDAIDCMEGNGPSGGTVRHVGATLASRSPYAVDYRACRVMGVDPLKVRMLALAVARGLLAPEELRMVGDELPPVEPPFLLPDSKSVDFAEHLPGPLRAPFRFLAGRLLKPYPALIADKCVGCGKCAESCPQHVIAIENGRARFARQGCISCFCCQELCPRQAVRAVRRLSGL